MDIFYIIGVIIIFIWIYKKFICSNKQSFLNLEPLMTTDISTIIASNSDIINKSDNSETVDLDKEITAKLDTAYQKLTGNLSDIDFRQIIRDEVESIPGTILEIDKSAVISETVKSHIFNYFITRDGKRYKYVIIAKVIKGTVEMPPKIEITFQNIDYNKFIYMESEPFYPFSLFTEFT
jgi:hypothetical protein